MSEADCPQTGEVSDPEQSGERQIQEGGDEQESEGARRFRETVEKIWPSQTKLEVPLTSPESFSQLSKDAIDGAARFRATIASIVKENRWLFPNAQLEETASKADTALGEDNAKAA